MDRFEGATTVRLKGAHGKYLCVEPDHYGISQRNEDKHQHAFWRVERSKTKTLRFKSCFDTYLTASQTRYHGMAFLSFSGKRVTQMRPESVDATTCFDWEPVLEQGRLRLKSAYGTYLRASSSAPPWSNCVTHDVPQHDNHLEWLLWEVGKVHFSNITPLELVVGPIHGVAIEHRPAQGMSKNPGATPGTTAGESVGRPVLERAKYRDEARARRIEASAARPAQGTVHIQGAVLTRRTNESDERLGGKRLKDPGVRAGDEAEAYPVHERVIDPVAGRIRRGEELGRNEQDRLPNPEVGLARRAGEIIIEPHPVVRKPDVGTASSDRHSARGRSPDAGVSLARGAEGRGRHVVQARERNLAVGRDKRTVELGHNEPQGPDAGSVRGADDLPRRPVRERATSSDMGTAAADELGGNFVHRMSRNPVVGTVRRADESRRRPMPESDENPDVGETRRTDTTGRGPAQARYDKSEIRSVHAAGGARETEIPSGQETTERDRESERRPAKERTERIPEMPPGRETDRRVHEFEKRWVQQKVDKLNVGNTERPEELERYPVEGKARNPGLGRDSRAEESERYPVYYPEEDRAKHLGVHTARRAVQ